MAERRKAEHGLVDAWTAELGGPRTAALLGRLDHAVAWETLVILNAMLRTQTPWRASLEVA